MTVLAWAGTRRYVLREIEMPNAVIKLLDSSAPMSKEALLKGLAGIPFVRHQYRWLVSELARRPAPAAKVMLAGYCGMRRTSPEREKRLAEACGLVASMTNAEISRLPETIAPVPGHPLQLPIKPAPGILGRSPAPRPKCH